MAMRLLALIALLPAGAAAQVPEAIGYQGVLTDIGGNPVNASLPVTFRLYAAEMGGTPLWQETHAEVIILNGIFNVQLGEVMPLTPADLPGGQDRWLAVKVDTDSEMAPRQLLVSVPYALRAGLADTANQLDGNTLTAVHATMDTKIAAHAGVANAHHTAKTTAQVRADINTDSAHGTDASHSYFTAADAVTAMGVIGNTNPLNHNRYTAVSYYRGQGPGTKWTSTNTGTWEIVTPLTVTPSAGTYLVWFSASVRGSSTGNILVRLVVNGSGISYSRRVFFVDGSIHDTWVPISFNIQVDVGAGQRVDVQLLHNAGTAEMWARTLSLLRL